MSDTGTTETLPSIACLHCGYDLRMITSAVCPECGQPIEREAEQVSQVPWVHRVVEGRIRTYFKTVLLMSFGRKRLANELNRPTDLSAARRFWIITSSFVALPLMAAYVLAWLNVGEWSPSPPSSLTYSSPSASTGVITLYLEVMLPWMMGIHFSPLMPLLIWWTVLTNFGISTYLIDSRRLGESQRCRAVALGYYACGSLIWFPLLAALGGGVCLVVRAVVGNLIDADHFWIAAIGVTGVGYLSIFIYWIRIILLRAKVRRSGVAMILLTIPLPPLLWIINSAIWLFTIPWMMGYLWMLIRSW